MARDFEIFPDDENGDVLWQMAQDGDDLSKPREMNYSVIFPSEDAALGFAVHLLKNGQKVSFAPYDGNDDFPWQVEAHPVMLPSHDNISGYEALIGEDAQQFGGRNDGWGCFAQG